MTDKTTLKARLTVHTKAYEKLCDAYLKLLEGGVKSYTIDDRSLTKFDLPDLKQEMLEEEKIIDELQGLIAGEAPRKAFGVLPRDW